ncbi:monovalent cation/H+ antiporter complex subunit F [Bosea sp. 124]|uniref:monovalent cation/H+ antiporter complex subunit F n=1 Tax=Bosea sp. 124 TaxID=2135642 RepID=UPI000D383E19|nr:monovalent cation/H+ antiporter complex subunit F [Bosea sp. 124]PTM39623.1 multisubunit sodium/proton antiporter MrpF subunit [Bosea sp. 124]
MAESLTATALLVLLASAAGLVAVLRSRIAIEKMMAVQLLGTGGAATLLLLGSASAEPALADVALLLVLLSAFSCAAFTLGENEPSEVPTEPDEPS